MITAQPADSMLAASMFTQYVQPPTELRADIVDGVVAALDPLIIGDPLPAEQPGHEAPPPGSATDCGEHHKVTQSKTIAPSIPEVISASTLSFP